MINQEHIAFLLKVSSGSEADLLLVLVDEQLDLLTQVEIGELEFGEEASLKGIGESHRLQLWTVELKERFELLFFLL